MKVQVKHHNEQNYGKKQDLRPSLYILKYIYKIYIERLIYIYRLKYAWITFTEFQFIDFQLKRKDMNEKSLKKFMTV